MIQGGIRKSTQRTYKSAHNKYIQFCKNHNLIAVPAEESTVLRFLAFLQATPGKKGMGLSLSTLNVSLAAIKFLHTQFGFSAEQILSPRVKLALRSVALQGRPPNKKSPITFDMLSLMVSTLSPDYDGWLWFTVLLTGYMGAMRGSEYTAVTMFKSTIVLSPPLSLGSVVFGVDAGLSYMEITIPRTKTSVNGLKKVIGCVNHVMCAVCAMKKYLQFRSLRHSTNLSSPLFISSNRVVVTKDMLNAKIKKLVSELGLDTSKYSSHSLRHGAASVAAANGMSDSDVMKLGAWRSQVFIQYIQHNVQTMANNSKLLVKNSY